MTDFDAIRRKIDTGHRPAPKIAPPPTAEEIDAELRDLPESSLRYYVEAVEPRMDRAWGSLTNAERKALRAANELARRDAEAAREQARGAEQTRERTRLDDAAAARRAEIAESLRLASGGALRGAALESAVDQVVAREAVSTVERQLVEKRRELGTL